MVTSETNCNQLQGTAVGIGVGVRVGVELATGVKVSVGVGGNIVAVGGKVAVGGSGVAVITHGVSVGNVTLVGNCVKLFG